MDEAELKKLLKNIEAGQFFRPVCLETVGSTNDCIKAEAEAGAKEGLLITAEEQTTGKGRSGRSWVSPKGDSLYFSFLLRPELPPDKISAVTLVMGLSAAQAIRGYPGFEAYIKWPNDIVVAGKKVCGILTEAAARNGAVEYVVVGTGINVNSRAFPKEIRDKATSLLLEGNGTPASKECVLALALEKFCRNYSVFLRTGNLAGLISEYNDLLISRGKEVRVEDPKGSYEAVSGGIDEAGRLLVEKADGTMEWITAGEVSVRGLYGYV